jgi:hypothetical protein
VVPKSSLLQRFTETTEVVDTLAAHVFRFAQHFSFHQADASLFPSLPKKIMSQLVYFLD